MCLFVHLFSPVSPSRTGCDTRLKFKHSKSSLNSDFSLSKMGGLTKVVEPSPLYDLPIAGDMWIYGHEKIIKPCSGFELWLPISFSTTITVTLNAPLCVYLCGCYVCWVPVLTWEDVWAYTCAPVSVCANVRTCVGHVHACVFVRACVKIDAPSSVYKRTSKNHGRFWKLSLKGSAVLLRMRCYSFLKEAL